jgi:PEP-CTERM putative exosortase interaction domain
MKNTQPPRIIRHSSAPLLALLAASAFPVAGMAQSVWDGGAADNYWETPENWVGDVPPASDAATQIQLAGNVNTNIVLGSPFTANRINVNSGAGSFTLSGALLTLGGGNHDTGETLRNQSSNLLTVHNDLKFVASTGFAASGADIHLTGNINLNGQTTRFITGNGSRTITIDGVISGSSNSLAYNGFGSNAGTIYVNNANTYTGTTNVWQSTVIAGNSSAFSTGQITMGPTGASGTYNATVLTGAALTIANNVRLSTNTNASGVNTQTVGGIHTSGTSTYSGNIFMGSDNRAGQTLTVTSVAGGRVDFTGNLLRASGATGDTDALVKIGGGIVTLAGSNNTYSGTTSVNEGTLLVNGTLASGGGAVTVGSGATLGGTGEIRRDVNLLSGSFLSVGDDHAGLVGELNIVGGLNLADGSTVKFDLGSTFASSDRISVIGSVTLGESVVFDLSALSGLADSHYTLLSASAGFIGDASKISFVGYDFSSTHQLVIDGNGISLVAQIPEPSAAGLLAGAGVLGWVASRRRRGA